ncbi:MAG: phage tail protein, partial [Bacteroidales bacterium]|nr:phage tail protein [Bacteroidales bacterium]
SGLQGFDVAENEEQQRELIKRSIALHKFIGTPWAIREACRTVGFPVVCIEEGVSSAIPSPNTDWARFRVLIEIDASRYIDKELSGKIRLFIEFYKNERSHLAEFGFFEALMDDYVFPYDEDVLMLDLKYNRPYAYSNAYFNAYKRIKYKSYGIAYSKAYHNRNRHNKAYSMAYGSAYSNRIIEKNTAYNNSYSNAFNKIDNSIIL